MPEEIHDDVEHVMGYVWHWIADGDIGPRDSPYRAMQESQMVGFIDALRRGASREELTNFTFLSW